MKKSIRKQIPRSRKAIVSDKVGNYEHHPPFVEKLKAAKEFVAKNGLPKELQSDQL